MRRIETERREAEQELIEEQARQDISFGDFFHKDYLPSCLNKKEKTLKIEGQLFKKWIDPVLGPLPFNKIKALNLTKIQKDMTSAGRSPRSIQYVMQITRQAWNVAMNNNVTISPFPKITLEKFDNNRIRFMTDDEIKTGIPFRSAGGGVFTKREKRLCYRLTILLCCI